MVKKETNKQTNPNISSMLFFFEYRPDHRFNSSRASKPMYSFYFIDLQFNSSRVDRVDPYKMTKLS